MRLRSAIVVGAILFIATIALWTLGRKDRLISVASAPRSSEAYDKALDNSAPLKSFDEGLLNRITVKNDPNFVELAYPSFQGGDQPIQARAERVGTNQQFELPGGSFSLTSIGVAYGEFPYDKRHEFSARLPGRFFHSDLRPFDQKELNEKYPREWERTIQWHGNFPSAQFELTARGIQGFRILSSQAFDARTHRQITSGYSLMGGPSKFTLNHDLKLWHAAPIELFVTIAHGPAKDFELKPEAGKVFRYPGGVLKLGAVVEGKSSSWSSSSNGQTNTVRIELTPDAPEKETVFLFLTMPHSPPIPTDIEFLDSNGKTLPAGSGGGSSGNVVVASVRSPRDRVAVIRLKHYPNVRRLIFSLPRVPDLPAENDSIENLFDARIPNLRIQSEYQFRETIEGIVQMNLSSSPSLNIPPGYFPRTFTNVTARDLLREYMRMLPQKRQARIDPETQTIHIEEHYLLKLWQRVRARFQGR